MLHEHLVFEHGDLHDAFALAKHECPLHRFAAGKKLGFAEDRCPHTAVGAAFTATLTLGLQTGRALNRGHFVIAAGQFGGVGVAASPTPAATTAPTPTPSAFAGIGLTITGRFTFSGVTRCAAARVHCPGLPRSGFPGSVSGRAALTISGRLVVLAPASATTASAATASVGGVAFAGFVVSGSLRRLGTFDWCRFPLGGHACLISIGLVGLLCSRLVRCRLVAGRR